MDWQQDEKGHFLVLQYSLLVRVEIESPESGLGTEPCCSIYIRSAEVPAPHGPDYVAVSLALTIGPAKRRALLLAFAIMDDLWPIS